MTTSIQPFTKLTTNVKANIEDQLGPLTAFLGENRTGKTARLDAIRLALTGKHPVGPHGSDMIELAAREATYLTAALEGPTGGTSFRITVSDKGKVEKPLPPNRTGVFNELTPDQLENILPAQAMSKLIKLGSTLGREAILTRFGEAASVPTPRGLTEAQSKLWAEGLTTVKKEKPKADASELLAELSSWMRSRKTSLGRDAKTLDKLLKEREQTVVTAGAGAEQLPGWKVQLPLAEAWERAAAARIRKTEIEREVEGYRTRAQPIMEADAKRAEEAAALEMVLTAKDHEAEKLDHEVRAIEAEIDKSVFNLHGGEWLLTCLEREGPCVLCSNADFDAHAARAQVEPRVAARRESIEQLRQQRDKAREGIAEITRQKLTATQAFEARFRIVDEQKNAMRQEYARIKSAKDENARALENAPEAYAGPTVEELRTRIRNAEGGEFQTKSYDEEMARYRRMLDEQEVAKRLEEEAKKALNTLLATTSTTANAAVNKYMPEGFQARLDLETAKWNVVGMDGKPHSQSVMAGSEQGALIPALALAWTEGAPARFLILEDEDLASFSPVNLRRLFDALKDAVDDGLLTQVFVAWSRPSEIPDYVHKVFVDGGVMSAAAPLPAPELPTLRLVQPALEPEPAVVAVASEIQSLL